MDKKGNVKYRFFYSWRETDVLIEWRCQHMGKYFSPFSWGINWWRRIYLMCLEGTVGGMTITTIWNLWHTDQGCWDWHLKFLRLRVNLTRNFYYFASRPSSRSYSHCRETNFSNAQNSFQHAVSNCIIWIFKRVEYQVVCGKEVLFDFLMVIFTNSFRGSILFV